MRVVAGGAASGAADEGDHEVAPACGRPVDRFARAPAAAELVRFVRLVDDPASERGFFESHLRARLLWGRPRAADSGHSSAA